MQIKAEIAEQKKLNEHSNECKGVQIETAANLVSANIIIHQMGIFKDYFSHSSVFYLTFSFLLSISFLLGLLLLLSIFFFFSRYISFYSQNVILRFK